MLQLVALFGAVCGGIGGYRLAKADAAPDPAKQRKNGITLVVFAAVLIGIGLFGAPIAIKLSGL